MSAFDFKGKNTTLVHICCSVDSHHFLLELKKKYPDKNFCGYFYNPNIHPYEEYEMRLKDVKRSCDLLGVPLIEGEYDSDKWLQEAKGMEQEPEKGIRCSYCFDYRLTNSAKVAKDTNCVEFTTTLLASPMKTQNELFAQGEKIALKYELDFLPIDVRSNGGTQIQSRISKEENLYRQNYCGCIFGLTQQRDRSNKSSFELFSSLSLPRTSSNLPKIRLKNFKTREDLETQNKKYQMIKKKVLAYRLLKGLLSVGDKSIQSFICSYSYLKKPIKSEIEFWQDGIGYAQKEGIVFLLFDRFKNEIQKDTFESLTKEGLDEKTQLLLRLKFSNDGLFTSPILIIKEEFYGKFNLEIESISQDEMIEDFVVV